jgi:hypothetical protein
MSSVDIQDVYETYTIKFHRTGHPATKVTIKHCIQDSEGNFYRPVAYANGAEERKPVKNPEREIGWDYEPVISSGYELDSIEKETK